MLKEKLIIAVVASVIVGAFIFMGLISSNPNEKSGTVSNQTQINTNATEGNSSKAKEYIKQGEAQFN